MLVSEFEEAVWNTDHIRVVVRAPHNAEVQAFGWQNAADQSLSITEYRRLRIESRIGPFGAVIINGDGQIPHGRTKIRNVRESYS